LAGAFNLWRRFAEPRRARQRAALQKIASAPELSPDVAEIVERNLAD
jgi:aminopeptidase N